MRILLDEGVPDMIQERLTQFSITTVQELQWRGIKNGTLLDLMAGRFEIIITTDKNLPFQQNLSRRGLAAIILPSNRIRILKRIMTEIAAAIDTIHPGEAVELKPQQTV